MSHLLYLKSFLKFSDGLLMLSLSFQQQALIIIRLRETSKCFPIRLQTAKRRLIDVIELLEDVYDFLGISKVRFTDFVV